MHIQRKANASTFAVSNDECFLPYFVVVIPQRYWLGNDELLYRGGGEITFKYYPAIISMNVFKSSCVNGSGNHCINPFF